MMSQPRKQTIAIYVLPDTSRSKGNQTMKFGQLMTWHEKYFSWKSDSQNVVGKFFPDPFLSKLSISLDQ